jgi:hypothetical protein
MAVNHADGTLFASILMYPIAAAYAAFGAGTRWTTPLFVMAGLAIGVLVVSSSRFLLYSAMGRILSSRKLHDENGWLAWIVGVPLMLVYLAFPIAISCGGIYMTWYVSLVTAELLKSP